MAGFSRDCKPLQFGIAHLRQPGSQQVAATRAQRLLRCPKRVIAVLGANDQQVHQVDPRGGQRRRIGHVRRRNPHRALPCARERSQRGQDQSQLTEAGTLVQHLGKGLAGPAAAGQLGL